MEIKHVYLTKKVYTIINFLMIQAFFSIASWSRKAPNSNLAGGKSLS